MNTHLISDNRACEQSKYLTLFFHIGYSRIADIVPIPRACTVHELGKRRTRNVSSKCANKVTKCPSVRCKPIKFEHLQER